MRDRYNLKKEITLAIMPAVTVIGVLILLKEFSKQQLLFSSLASSAFLIYLDPKHPTNSIRTLAIAQTSAAIIGYLTLLVAGPGYLGASFAMIIVITVMILTHAMHPPAVSSALLFAFQPTNPNALLLYSFSDCTIDTSHCNTTNFSYESQRFVTLSFSDCTIDTSHCNTTNFSMGNKKDGKK